MSQQPDLWRPALISGAAFGIASAIPIVSLLNCLCCSLIISSGVLTTWMMVRGSTVAVTYGQAALGGAIAGAVAAVTWGLATLLVGMALQRDFTEDMREAAERTQQMTGEDVAAVLEGIAAPVMLAIGSCILIVIWVPFGIAGGVIGRAIFEKRPPAATAAPEGLDTMPR
ncbi:MAG: hypothetical protein ACREAA_01000 [Candidatus Polarisedimenticolia bacterium]